MNKKEVGILNIPIIASLIVVVILHSILGDMIKINNLNIITSSYIAFVGTLVGFLITTITIVIGFFNKKIIKTIVSSKKDKILYINWIITIIIGMISVLFVFFLAATTDSSTNEIHKILLDIILFLTISFIGYLTMSLIYFFGIAMCVMQESNKEDIRTPELDSNKLRNPNTKK